MGKSKSITIGEGFKGILSPERICDPDKLVEGLKLDSEERIARKLQEIVNLLWLPNELSKEEIHARLACAIELYECLAPADGAEAMLAQQMVGTHHAAMECLRRANLANQSFEGRDMALKHATKLMSLYEKQLSALNKSRGKGQQKVTVEHVHVEAGGQAIVGNVEAGGGPAPRQDRSDGAETATAALHQDQDVPFDLAARSRSKARRRGS